jgi:predicted lactoylglutathione lyase
MCVKIAVNLPVKSLDRSVGFFTQLGFAVNPQLTSDATAHLIVSDEISIMLLTAELFSTVTNRPVADTATSAEAVVQLQLDSRERVDELVDAAVTAGGRIANPPNDQGFLYGRSFTDLDGHHWDAFHIDPSLAPTAQRTTP